MTLISTYRGNKFHAPENTRFALISAYVSGANVLEFDVQQTKDERLVVVAPGSLSSLTDSSNTVANLTRDELNELDLGAKFKVRGSDDLTWKRTPPRVRAETLGGLLDNLPTDVVKVAQIHLTDIAQADGLTKRVIDIFKRRGLLKKLWIASSSFDVLKSAATYAPGIITAFVGDMTSTLDDLQQWTAREPPALILPVELILDDLLQLTAFAQELQAQFDAGKIPNKVIVRASETNGIFIQQEYELLKSESFIYALSSASVINQSDFARQQRILEESSFDGKVENSARVHFGYAKANRFAHVFQDDGVHIKIEPYQSSSSITAPPTDDPIQRKLNELEEEIWNVARDWPFYSGGGFGTAFGVDGDFIAEVDFSMEFTSQATMCEMAVTNVDPGRHITGWIEDENGNLIPNTPKSFRDKNCFFDPHGAPPFVGVEHDEDDGYRANYNLGTEYDNNQYGRPHGDGQTKKGRFRLERRGAYFAAYYMDTKNSDWVCCGVCRNDSMNERLFIRCAGKRWRQENNSKPGGYFPIPENHFVFKNFIVKTFLEE